MSIRQAFISLLFIALSFGAMSQEPEADVPGHLLPKIEKTGADTIRVQLLLQLGFYYICKPGQDKTDLDSAMTTLTAALRLSQQLHSMKYICQTLKLQGDCYLEAGDLQRGGACFQQVVDHFRRIRDTSGEINTWLRWGDCIMSGRVADRIPYYMAALRKVPEINDPRRLDIFDRLGDAYRYKPGEEKEDMDSAIWYFSRGERMAIRLNLPDRQAEFIENKAYCYVESKDVTHARPCIEQVTGYYHRMGNKREEAHLLINMAHLLPRGTRENAVYLGRALQLLQQLPVHDEEYETGVLKDLADADLNEGRIDLAERELHQVLDRYRAIGYKKLQYTYDLLAAVYDLKGYPDKRLSCNLESLNYMKSSGDTIHAADLYFSTALDYHALGFEDQCLFYLDKALLHPLQDVGDTLTYCRIVGVKAHILAIRGMGKEGVSLIREAMQKGFQLCSPEGEVALKYSLALIYELTGEWSRSLSYYMDVMPLVEKLTGKSNIDARYYGAMYGSLANLYILLHQFGKAEACLKKIGVTHASRFSAEDLSDFYLARFKVDSAYGNYKGAIAAYQMYHQLRDSIFNLKKHRQIQELEISYETAQKERSIADLQNNEKVQRADLNKANAQRDLTLIGIAFMLVIATLAFIGFRQKRRSNIMLQAHQKEIDDKNESLGKLNYKQELLLVEKEWLMREIHHRVKNNLQTTISLLHMQSVYLSNEEALTAIRNSQRRMQAMSLIHQRLYQSDDMASIDMSSYIPELISYLKESFQGAGNITFDLRIDPVILDVAKAVPLGLIVNEAITNAIKHAFPDNRKGRIIVSLKKAHGNNRKLSIADDGVGIPADLDPDNNHETLGLNLIRGLTDQLHGEFVISGDHGTTVQVSFDPGIQPAYFSGISEIPRSDVDTRPGMGIGKVLLPLLLLVSSTWATAQEPDRDIPDHLLPRIGKSKPDTERVTLLLQLAYYYICKPEAYTYDLDSAMNILNTALDLSQDLHSIKYIHQTLKLKGDCYLEGGDLRRGGACFQQVVDYYHRTRDFWEEMKVLKRWGECIPWDHTTEKITLLTRVFNLVNDRMDDNWSDLFYELGDAHRYREDLQDLDKALWYFSRGEQFSRSIKDTEDVYYYIEKQGLCYLEKKELARGITCFEQVIGYYHRKKDKKEEANKLITLASKLSVGYPSEKAVYLEKAVLLLRQLPVHDREFEIHVLRDLAEAHLETGKLDLAEEELHQVLAAYKAIGYTPVYYTYVLLGSLYNTKGFPDKMLSSYLQSIASARSSGDTSEIQFLFVNIAYAYGRMDMDEKSMFYADKVLSYPADNADNIYWHCQALHQKNYLLINNGQAVEGLKAVQKAIRDGWMANRADNTVYLKRALGDAYSAMGLWPKAEASYLEALHVADSVQPQRILRSNFCAFLYYDIAHLYVRMHAYKKAENFLNRIGDVPSGKFSALELSRQHFLHFKIDSAYGNYTSAIREYEVYNQLLDSIVNAKKQRQFQELEISYETAQKESAITDLQNREKVQAAELSKANAQKKLTLAGISLTLVIAGLAFTGFRQKRRSNIALQAHQQEISDKNASLEKLNYKQELLLTEKEWLMREIHHRVKNNLQTTISLLHMQSVYLSNEEALTAIRNSQRRMQAMSLIHQRLYQSGDMASIDMSSYIAELISYLKESFQGAGNITFEPRVDPVILEVAQAVPLGLIINEAITNAIKYAFPYNRNGRIMVSLKKGPEGDHILCIADDGVGLPADFDASGNHGSLGLNLIRGLTDQLQGEFRIGSDGGTVLSIIFKPNIWTEKF